jgi:hypothetical protein
MMAVPVPPTSPSEHWFSPSQDAKPDIDALTEQFHAYFTKLALPHTPGLSAGPGRVVYATGTTQSDFGFQLALSLAKRSGLLVDLLNALPEPEADQGRIPEILTLHAAGIPFEHNRRVGSVERWLPTHLAGHVDVVAVVVEYADLKRHGLLRVQDSLLPT